MDTRRVALVTCATLPELDPDDRLLLRPLAERGITTDVVVWDNPAVDWGRYDLAVLRSTWDYAKRRDEFVAWAVTVPRLANPPAVVDWNTDKRYLAELAERGVPVVATEWVEPAQAWSLPESGEWVIKPAISAGSLDTGRYDLGDPLHRDLARQHLGRLQGAERLVMVQPYLESVEQHGETALLFLGGAYSHTIRKGAMLDGPDSGAEGLFKPERISAREPTPEERAVADAALAIVRGGPLLYARVDLIHDDEGRPVVVELELTEPSLFLSTAPGAADRLAAAIAAAAAR